MLDEDHEPSLMAKKYLSVPYERYVYLKAATNMNPFFHTEEEAIRTLEQRLCNEWNYLLSMTANVERKLTLLNDYRE